MCDIKEDFPKDIKLYNAIEIVDDNIAIERIKEKCIDCGLCKTTCKEKEGIDNIQGGRACVYCGQCIQACPVAALVPKSEIFKVKLALESKKVCIAYVAPAVKASMGEFYGIAKGSFVQGKIITALRKLGFKYVFDVSCAADITVVEEAAELVKRIKNKERLPMFTSCCPSWVKYVENFYPEVLNNLSTCKSPISMQGAVVDEVFCNELGLDRKDVFTVAITPCTSKKYEVSRKELPGTDAVLTAKELSELIDYENISFKNLKNSEYDHLFGEGSGGGMIFGSSGGVTEAVIRTVYKILVDKNLPEHSLSLRTIRDLEHVKEMEIEIKGAKLKVAVVSGVVFAKPLIEEIKRGNSPYHFIEVMNCYGGCVGGGGQPKIKSGDHTEIKEKRRQALYQKDEESKIRLCHQNPVVVKLYNEHLGFPLSAKAEEVLHTYYSDKSRDLKE